MTSKKPETKTPASKKVGGSWSSAFERLTYMYEIFKHHNAVGMTINQIHECLAEKGIKTTVRTTQRVMVELEESKLFQRFPLAYGRGQEALWTITPRVVHLLGMPESALTNIRQSKTQAEVIGTGNGGKHEYVSKT